MIYAAHQYGVCAAAINSDTRKKVNDSAPPFLITSEDIKINLNKRHADGPAQHTFDTQTKWDVIMILYFIQNMPKVHNLWQASEKRCDCETSTWWNLAMTCYSLSHRIKHIWNWCTFCIASTRNINFSPAILFFSYCRSVCVRLCIEHVLRRWKHFTCRCLWMANTLHCMLHFARAMYEMLRFSCWSHFHNRKPFCFRRKVCISTNRAATPTALRVAKKN